MTQLQIIEELDVHYTLDRNAVSSKNYSYEELIVLL